VCRINYKTNCAPRSIVFSPRLPRARDYLSFESAYRAHAGAVRVKKLLSRVKRFSVSYLRAATNQVSSKNIMNCFQHIPESCGALHSPCGGAPQQREHTAPCGGAPQQRGPMTPQTQTRPNRLHTHTHPPKRLAHPRSPIPPLSTLTSRATHAHPTSPRSTGLCAIWGCISSSSGNKPGAPGLSANQRRLNKILSSRTVVPI